MTGNITYESNQEFISKEKMQIQVIHCRPKYTVTETKTVKADITQKLFTVFCKYANENGGINDINGVKQNV